jgi:hypothetical protein
VTIHQLPVLTTDAHMSAVLVSLARLGRKTLVVATDELGLSSLAMVGCKIESPGRGLTTKSNLTTLKPKLIRAKNS